jgi:phytoene synthase
MYLRNARDYPGWTFSPWAFVLFFKFVGSVSINANGSLPIYRVRGKTNLDSKDYTKKKTKKSKTNFYYSFLFLPKKKREAIYTVYSFCRYSDDIVDDAKTPDDARKRLDKWRHEVDRCYECSASHPILVAMMDLLQDFTIPKTYLMELIDGMEMDLLKMRYDTFDELSKYCYHAASVVGLMCIEKALQLTNILRDIGEDAEKGRIYVPREDYHKFNLTEADLLSKQYSPHFTEFMQYEIQRARDLFQLAMDNFEKSDHHLLFPAEIMRKIYYHILELIVANEYDVFSQRICVSKQRKIYYALAECIRGQARGLLQWTPAS